MSEPLLYRVEDGLARITLNRPQRLNAFNADLAHAWAEATAAAVRDSAVGAILIEGKGARSARAATSSTWPPAWAVPPTSSASPT